MMSIGTAIGHKGQMLLQQQGNKAQGYCNISSKRHLHTSITNHTTKACFSMSYHLRGNII